MKSDRRAFSPTLLRSFVAVAQQGHFTAAARQLGLSQSTVSQHIGRLEAEAGCGLLLRDTHSVLLTTDGDAMLVFARQILEAQDQALSYFDGSVLRGRLRFGVSEDLVLSRLPDILRGFVEANPLVDLDLVVELSHALHEQLDAGRLDLIFAKRQPGDTRGQTAWREQLAWIGIAQTRISPTEPVPLVLYQAPTSITRRMTIEALQRDQRPWRIACTCPSLTGASAAVLAGLGVMVQSSMVLRDGLRVLTGQPLPEPGPVDFIVLGRSARLQGPAAALAGLILETGRKLWSTRDEG